ncbi:MAG: type II toxin-antitoxin system RelE/ParE family toxin [Alphaproteobacteria bacterium]|nr:type II toxin-antitoxin system RelE/ParE family toxin [Alphaproteobacteria bacterium]
MIKSFRHKPLRKLYEAGETKGINAQHLKRIEIILTRLEASAAAPDMDLPGLRLHPLKGDMKGFHAVDVSGNWRIVFRFEGGDAYDVDLVDYH